MAALSTWVKRVALTGFFLFLTGLFVAALQGRFTVLPSALCIVGLACASAILVRRVSRNIGLYAKMTLYSTFFILSALALFFIVQRHPAVYDATRQKTHSITPLTARYMERLTRPVHVTAFTVDADKDTAGRLLREYARYSPQFSFEVLNPFREVSAAQRFGPTVQPGDVFVEVYPAPGPGDTATTDPKTAARVVKVNKLVEEELTNAIVQGMRDRDLTLYFLTNHGELPLERSPAALLGGQRVTLDELDVLKQQLDRNYIRVVPLDLSQRGRVPAGASAVVSVAPRTDLSPAERQALESYLRDGGRAIFLLGPQVASVGSESRMPLRNLSAMLEAYGVLLPADMVISETRQQGSPTATFGVPVQLLRHPITEIGTDVPLVFQQARPVLVSKSPAPQVRVEPLLTSPQDSWRVPIDQVAAAILKGQRITISADARERGPQVLGAAVTMQPPGQPEENATRIVVMGNGDFLASSVIDQAGWMLFLRSVNWLTNAGDLIAIPGTKVENTPVNLTQGQRQFLFLLMVIIVPTLIGFLGLGYSLARRELQ